MIHDINYRDSFQYADVVAVLDVTDDITTFPQPHHHTLYRSTIVQWLKGESSPSVHLYQREGYYPRHDVFVHLNLDPWLKPHEQYLLFLHRRTIGNAKHPVVYAPSWVYLHVINQQLYSFNHFHTVWREILSGDREMPIEIRKRLGYKHLTSMYERLHVENLSLQEFIDTYCKPN
jgi:hypothetical protein